MRILAIETSCDETAIAIAEFFGSKKKPKVSVLSNIVSSQVKLHAKYGGVVPNLAKREHQKNLPVILSKALKEGKFLNPKIQMPNIKQISNIKIKTIDKILEREPELLQRFKKHIFSLSVPDIDAIAVTIGPGLAPALWVGVNFARALSYLWKRPIIPVNHMAGHVYSALLQKSGVENPKYQIPNYKFKIQNLHFPVLALLVSGGHTELVLVKNHGKYKIIGETLDDAAGEAFDKVARLLGLGYPGGPALSRLAKKGNPDRYSLPSPMLHSKNYNFSFSGLKTAVLYLIRDVGDLISNMEQRANIAASFEKAVVDVLVAKTLRAAREYRVKTVLLGGGVAANTQLRERLAKTLAKELPKTSLQISPFFLTGDNALMIALAAFFAGKSRPWEKIKAGANLRLDASA